MEWNWQKPDWPEFSYDETALEEAEAQFLRQSGELNGSLKHIQAGEKDDLTVELISTEAVKTSEIEGEILNRDSVQSSVRRNFGLDTDNRNIPPAEQGIAEMMVNLYETFADPLSHEKLFNWHRMLTGGRTDLNDIGRYRTHEEPMQVISGVIYDPDIHFEAPPSAQMQTEMDRFIEWFNQTAPDGEKALTPLTRAGIAHLFFVCVHPFEDGNGRIGRAIADKALSQCLGHPTLLALSLTIQNAKKDYYRNLELNNKELEITAWLRYFSDTVLSAQDYTQRLIDFLIEKTKLYDRIRDKLNERQAKAIARMFREGLEGFKGGLSAENYISITGTSRATATRDLQNLVEIGALMRTGERRHTRYWLNLPK